VNKSVAAEQSCCLQQYWAGNPNRYEFVGVSQLAKAFQKSGISSENDGEHDLEKGRNSQDEEGKKGTGLDPLVHQQ